MTKSVENSTYTPEIAETPGGMRRQINWVDAFWIVSGASTLILFSIGSMAGIVGTPSWAIWGASTLIGFIQLFVYAEISGMFPNRSGGAAVYGAIAWRRFGKFFAPFSIWCNWLGWSPVLAIGASIAGSYIVSAFFGSDSAIGQFSVTLLDLSFIGIKFQLNASILIGMAILFLAFYLQHSGVLRMARLQFLIAVLSLVPILLLSVVPLLTGKVDWSHFVPFIPKDTQSWWSPEAFTLVMGGMFIAAWTTYACETSMCYVSEFRDPNKDTIRAVVSSGLLGLVAFTALPFVFLGVLGMNDPDLVAADPQAAMVKMAELTFGHGIGIWVTILLIMALILSIVTAMAGGSRTLYQSSVEGWLPKYLSKLNSHGAPTNAMWTDLVFNLILLTLGSPIFVLAASSVAYVIFVAMNLNAAWIHRIDRPNHYRPFRAPDWLIYVVAPLLSILNIAFIIFGANVFAPNALWYGLGAVLLIVPIFYYRHYVVDKGEWPAEAQEDLGIEQPLP
jgi:amino acid transporter